MARSSVLLLALLAVLTAHHAAGMHVSYLGVRCTHAYAAGVVWHGGARWRVAASLPARSDC
jgi:hypothetical protein